MLKFLRLLFVGIFIFVFFAHSFAQKTTLRGIVSDAKTKKPIEYANIYIKKLSTGTTTDSKGKFNLNITIRKKLTLVVSHINYHKKEFIINDSLLSGEIIILLTPKETKLSGVVISAGLYEQSIEKLTRSADLILHTEIVDNMNSNMTDLLSKTPGFTQIWEYHSPIILRGLNSNRLIIMKDGNRRIGTFPGGYFGQDMNIYDSRKIEIIKGAGSVIYGSGAISGIINVISSEPFGKRKNSVQFSSGYGSNNNELLGLIKLCHKRKKFGVSVNSKYRKTGEMLYGNGEIAENSQVEDRDIALNTGYKFSDKHKIIINANYHYGDWGKPRGFNGPTKRFTKIRNKEENFHTDFAYTYNPKGFLESVILNLYYDNGWRDYYQYKFSTVSGKVSSLNLVHYKDHYGGGRFYTILNLLDNNKLTTGVDAYLFRLDNPAEIIDYYNNTQGNIKGVEKAGQQNLGVFINDEWQIGDKWKFVSGIRFDVAAVLEGSADSLNGRKEHREAFSGNAGLVFSPNTNAHISFNVGRGSRMPTTEELFTRTISCKGIKMGNPNLKPEYSWNFDLGIRGRALEQKLRYNMALFYNVLDDFINEAPAPQPDIDFTLKNTDAQLLGGELSAAYRFSNVIKSLNSLYLGSGLSYVYGNDLSDKQNAPLFGIPPLKTNIELTYKGYTNSKWVSNYSLKFDTEYAMAQNRIAEIPEGTDGGPWGYVPSKSHTIFNFSTGIKSNSLPGNPKIRFVVRNILNADYQPFGSYISSMGRNIKILLSFHF